MGKSSGSQTVTQKTKLPPWYETAAQDAIAKGTEAANMLARPYSQNAVAGIDPITANAINLTARNVGSTNGAYQLAQQGAANVMGYRPEDVYAMAQQYGYQPLNVSGGSFLTGNLDAYMNPYIQDVENNALSNMGRAYQQNLNTIGDQATGAHAFGGSRHGIAEGVAASENARQMGDLSAQLRSQAYTAGTDLMGQDLSRNLQAALANQQAGMSNAQFGANVGLQNNQAALQAALANQQAGLQGAQMNLSAANSIGSLAGQQQQEYLRGLQSAIAAGQINQQQAQALMDQQVSQYDAMRNYPLEQLNIMLSALGGTQVPTSTSTKTPTSGNFLTGAAGGALAGMSMGPWGALAGGLLGGIAST